jgi:hypothetical protein
MVNIESIFVVKGEYNNSQTFQVSQSQSQKKEMSMSIDITTRITKNAARQHSFSLFLIQEHHPGSVLCRSSHKVDQD